MGNATLQRCVASFVRERVGDFVKDVDEKLLQFSLRPGQCRVSLKTLALQEKLLENLGVFLPYAVHKAWLEDVTLSLDRGKVVCAKASRVVIHGEVRHRDMWVDMAKAELDSIEEAKDEYLREHEAAAVGGAEPTEGGSVSGGSMLVPELELEIGGVEILVDDCSSQPHAPFSVALTASRLATGKRLPLGGKRVAMTVDLQVEDIRLACSESMLLAEALSQPSRRTPLPAHGVSPRSARAAGASGPSQGDLRSAPRVIGTAERTRCPADLQEATIIGPCPWMQIEMTFTNRPGMRPSIYPEISPRRTVAPAGLGRGDDDEPLAKKYLAIRTSGGSISASQSQLALVVAHGQMWGLWVGLRRDVELTPPEEEVMLYHSHWLDLLSGGAKSIRSSDAPRDPIVTAFEKNHSLEQVLYQRRRALFSLTSPPPLSPSKGDPVGCWTLRSSGAFCPHDPTYRVSFLLDVDVSDMVVELRSDAEPSSGANPLTPGSIVALRVAPLNTAPSDFRIRFLLNVDDHPDIAPTSMQFLMEDSVLELKRGDQLPVALIENPGLFYTCIDLQGHADGTLFPKQPALRCHIGALGSLRGYLDFTTLLDAVGLVAGAMDVISALDPCAGLAQGNAELLTKLVEADAVSERLLPPTPTWPPFDLRTSTAEPLVLAFPASSEGILMVRLQPIIGPPSQWEKLCPRGRHDEALWAAGEEVALRISILGLVSWTTDDLVEQWPDEKREMVRCEELTGEVGHHAVVARLESLSAQVSAREVAILTAVAKAAAHAGASAGEPAASNAALDELDRESTPDQEDDVFKLSCAAGDDQGEFALHLHATICRINLALYSPGSRTPALQAQLGSQTLLLEVAGGSAGFQVECAEYRLQRFAVSDSSGRCHIVHCGSPGPNLGGLGAISVLLESRPPDHLPSVHCEVAPLWISAHWQTLTEALACANTLQEAAAAAVCAAPQRRNSRNSNCGSARGSVSSMGSDEHSREQQDRSTSAAAQECRVRLVLHKVAVFVPCVPEEGLLLQLELRAACDPLSLWGPPGIRATTTVSRLLLATAPPPDPSPASQFRLPLAPQEGLLLQPSRLRLQLDHSSHVVTRVSAKLEVSPVSIFLHTHHFALVLAIQAHLDALSSVISPPAASSHGQSGRQSSLAAIVPPAAPPAQTAPATAADEAVPSSSSNWLCQLSVVVPVIQVELGVPPEASELGVAVLEDLSLHLSLASSGAAEGLGVDEENASLSSDSKAPPPPTSSSLVRAVTFKCMFWSDITSHSTGEGLPFLEPVILNLTSMQKTAGMDFAPADRLSLAVTWVNLQILSDTAAAGARLLKGLAEVREAESASRPTWVREEEDPSEWESEAARPAPPPPEPPREASARKGGRQPPSLQPPSPLEEAQASTLRSLDVRPELLRVPSRARQASVTPLHTPKRSNLRLRNCLGQTVKVLCLEHGATHQDLHDGETLELSSLLGPGGHQRTEERQGWETRLGLLIPGCQVVGLPLLPTPQVLQVPVAQGLARFISGVSTGSRNSLVKVHLKEWVNGTLRVRTAAKQKGAHRMVLARRGDQEAQISSIVYVENRSAASVVVLAGDFGEVSGGNFLELPPGSPPKAVPLAWTHLTSKRRNNGLWCCPAACASELENEVGETLRSKAQSLVDAGIMEPLVSKKTWQQIQQYRSMVADQYFLPARRLQGRLAGLCATACAVSARLRAEHQALFFAVVLEPEVQICNRLCCNVQLEMPGQKCLLLPGQDAGVLDPSALAHFELDVPSGTLKLQQPVSLEEQQGRGLSSLVLVFADAQGAELEAFLHEEPGLLAVESWGRLQVRQYSPLTRRLTIYTTHWLLNRCRDAQVFVPGYELGVTEESTVELRHVPRHSLRLLSQHVVRRNSIQVGLYEPNSLASPLSPALAVGRPTEGEAVVPAGLQGQQRCLGYTVRTAPYPFYRTLLVELTRRFTLVNHTQRKLWCIERFQPSSSVFELPAGTTRPFDPQGLDPQLRINAVGPQAQGYSAFFSLNITDGGQRRHFQLLHMVNGEEYEGRCTLLEPIPLAGGAPKVAGSKHSTSGEAWCVAAVDILLSSGAVVVRFADPPGPAFRIVNRTGHALQLQQDCAGAPSLDLPPEHTMPFAWFSPCQNNWLLVRVPSCGEHQRYEIGQVKVHGPHLSVTTGGESKGRSTRWRSRMTSRAMRTYTELFKVRTRVRLGCREVHLHPWVRLNNWTEEELSVRLTYDKAHEVHVRRSCSICLHPGPNAMLSLQIRDAEAPASRGWSQPIKIGRRLVGTKGYLRHPRAVRGLDPEDVACEGASRDPCWTTEVEVQPDTTSDFLVVQLRPSSHQPYLFENLSSYPCTVAPLGAAGWAIPLPRRGGQVPFPSHLWADLNNPLGISKAAAATGAPSRSRASHATIVARTPAGNIIVEVNMERTGVLLARPLRIWVKKERPRIIIVQDAPMGHNRTSFKVPRFLTMAWKVVDVGAELASSAPRVHRDGSPLATPATSPFGFQMRTTTRRTDCMSPVRSPSRHTKKMKMPLGRRITKSLRLSHMLLLDSFMTEESEAGAHAVLLPQPVAGQAHSQPASRAATRRLQVSLEGLGVTMVDEVALSEVAFLLLEGLVFRVSWKQAPEVTEVMAHLQAIQLDVREGWSTDAVLKPTGSRTIATRPLAKLHAVVLAKDGGKDWEMRHFSLGVQPVDLCLDTRNVYELAEWALELAGQACPAGSGGGNNSTPVDDLPLGRAEDSLRRIEGDYQDPLCGEPLHVLQPRAEDFEASAPVFARSLTLRRLQCMLSVHFSGRLLGDFRNSEQLQALDHVLRHCLPLDFDDAKVLLGRKSTSWGSSVQDVRLKDEFLPDGFGGLAEGLLADCAGNFLMQVPSILFSQRLLGSPAKLLQELCQSFGLAVFAIVTCKPKTLLSAVLMVCVAVLFSLEGIFETLAKFACNLSTGSVPAALRREPSSSLEALRQMMELSLSWHARSLFMQWRRLGRAIRTSNSCTTRCWCLLLTATRGVFTALSLGLVPVVKLIQALRIFLQHAAWQIWPESGWGRPTARRACPQQFRSGVALQFACASAPGLSFSCADALGAVCKEKPAWSEDWRLRPLPDGEGVLVAVQSWGLFLVRDVRGHPQVVWQAPLAGSQPEVVARRSDVPASAGPPFLLRFQVADGERNLGLKSWEAALAAFCFVAECWADDRSPLEEGYGQGSRSVPTSRSVRSASSTDSAQDLESF